MAAGKAAWTTAPPPMPPCRSCPTPPCTNWPSWAIRPPWPCTTWCWGCAAWGRDERYPDLEARQKLEALDVFLFLADQVRFEVMVRLGWLSPGPVRGAGILEMAKDYRRFQAEAGRQPLRLTKAYPSYQQVERRMSMEPEAVVRSVIPQALAAFKAGLA